MQLVVVVVHTVYMFVLLLAHTSEAKFCCGKAFDVVFWIFKCPKTAKVLNFINNHRRYHITTKVDRLEFDIAHHYSQDHLRGDVSQIVTGEVYIFDYGVLCKSLDKARAIFVIE